MAFCTRDVFSLVMEHRVQRTAKATASLSAIFRLDLWISTFILVEDRSQLESRTTALAKPKLNHVGHVDPLLYPRDILPS